MNIQIMESNPIINIRMNEIIALNQNTIFLLHKYEVIAYSNIPITQPSKHQASVFATLPLKQLKTINSPKEIIKDITNGLKYLLSICLAASIVYLSQYFFILTSPSSIIPIYKLYHLSSLSQEKRAFQLFSFIY